MGLSSLLGASSAGGFSLSNITNDIQQFVVAPIAAFGLAGFVFTIEGESIATLSTEITDHYTEDNKSVQDHIAIRPKKITLKGYVGELIYSNPGSAQTPLQSLAQKLATVGAYIPTLTATAQQAIAAGTPPLSAANVLGSASNIYGIVQNLLGSVGNTKNQQNAYNYFKSLMQTGTLMGVQTPWEFMTNMAIENITAIQPENSMFISDFAVTLKEIRIAQTSTTAFSSGTTGTNAGSAPAGSITMTNIPVLAPIAAAQAAPVTQQGPTPGAVTPETIAELGPN